MAIQFHCPGCSQPIEVDDVHAGQSAACPYCRRVVNVPTESTLPPGAPVSARPTTGAGEDDRGTGPAPAARPEAAPPPVPLDVGAARGMPGDRDRSARVFGNYALICTAVAVVLLVGTTIYGLALFADEYAPAVASQASVEEVSRQFALEHPELSAALLGAMFFAVVGLALGITSIRQASRGNWRGIVSTAMCGFFVVCFCGINALALFTGGLGVPAGVLGCAPG